MALSLNGDTGGICGVKSCKTAVMPPLSPLLCDLGQNDRLSIRDPLVIPWFSFEKCKFVARVENYLVSSIVSYFRTKQETAVVYEGF